MLTTDLFEEVLIKPIKEGANKLAIVSGFATSAMAFYHLDKIRKLEKSVDVSLILGMSKQVGVSLSNHRNFQKLVEEDFAGNFRCSYIQKKPPVHSKIYVWLRNNQPFKAFMGSANYTQFAFNIQREILNECDADLGLKYFNELSSETIYCNHLEVEDYITIYSDKQYYQRFFGKSENIETVSSELGQVKDLRARVKVSLLMRNGEVHNTGGLNWAFRGKGKKPRKNLNEAYIPLRPEVYRSDFFPPRGVEFSGITDDGIPLIFSRGQKSDASAISTPQGNGLLGEYFRSRLELPYGTKVTRKHLDGYGRTDVEFFKNDDETYEMDFSV